jgi:hypothetical protein
VKAFIGWQKRLPFVSFDINGAAQLNGCGTTGKKFLAGASPLRMTKGKPLSARLKSCPSQNTFAIELSAASEVVPFPKTRLIFPEQLSKIGPNGSFPQLL